MIIPRTVQLYRRVNVLAPLPSSPAPCGHYFDPSNACLSQAYATALISKKKRLERDPLPCQGLTSDDADFMRLLSWTFNRLSWLSCLSPRPTVTTHSMKGFSFARSLTHSFSPLQIVICITHSFAWSHSRPAKHHADPGIIQGWRLN